MPRQVEDVLTYKDQAYQFVLDGGAHAGLFRPEDSGIFPVDSLDECWNGFQAEYAVRDGKLVIEHLHVKLTPHGADETVVGPRIHRVAPAAPEYGPFRYGEVIRLDLFDNHYWNINQRLWYTGRLLALKDKIWFENFAPHRVHNSTYGDDYRVHSYFAGPWAYKQVVELTFDRGVFVTATDQVANLVAERLDGTYGSW